MRRSGPSLLRVVVGAVLLAFAASAVGHACYGFDALEHSGLLPPCVFNALFRIDCPGCGMTRSFSLLSQLRIGDAFRAHPAGPVLLATMTCYVAAPHGRVVRIMRDAAPALLVAVLAIWIARF